MSGYNELMKKVRSFLLAKKRVDLSELLKWAADNEIGLITLSMIVSDLRNDGIVRYEGALRKLNEGPLTFTMPEIIIVNDGTQKVVEVNVPERKTPEKQTPPPPKLRFSPLFSSLTIEEPPPPKPQSIKPEEKAEPKGIKAESDEVMEISEESAEAEEVFKEYDEDLRKAIEYLNEYHSVGELRFVLDLKALGVKEPKDVLYRLIDMGFVERKPLGVIDATDKLPKVRKKRRFPELSEFV